MYTNIHVRWLLAIFYNFAKKWTGDPGDGKGGKCVGKGDCSQAFMAGCLPENFSLCGAHNAGYLPLRPGLPL